MSTDTNKNIEKLEADLWEAADNLRAAHNLLLSRLASGEIAV